MDTTYTDSINDVAVIGTPLLKITTDTGIERWSFNWNLAGTFEVVSAIGR